MITKEVTNQVVTSFGVNVLSCFLGWENSFRRCGGQAYFIQWRNRQACWRYWDSVGFTLELPWNCSGIATDLNREKSHKN
jgi:hypothetical protein